MINEKGPINNLSEIHHKAENNQDLVKYEKKYEGRSEIRDRKEGVLEANKRRKLIPIINEKISELLRELNISKFITKPTGSVFANMCNKFSDIDLELLIPETSQTINTLEFTDRLNKKLSIPYGVHVFPIYVGSSYFE